MSRFASGDPGHLTEHNLIAGGRFNVKDPLYGAVGNGTTDDTPAFEAALDAIRSLDTPASSRGATLYIPPGVYRLTAPLEIDRGLRLVGAGGGGWYSPTVLLFDDGVPGIIVHRNTTSGDGGRGDWSAILDIAVKAAGKTVTGSHGIDLRARGFVERVYVAGFSGNGVHVDSSSGTNANGFALTSVLIDNCTGHGVFCDGADSNAGVGMNVDASSNGGWGIYDSSFLGNLWIGCHAQNNGLGGYKSDGEASGGSFIACYSEGGQPPSTFAGYVAVIGGTNGAGITGAASGQIRSTTFRSAVRTGGAVTVRSDDDSDKRWTIYGNGDMHWFNGTGTRLGVLKVNTDGSLQWTNSVSNTVTQIAP